MKKYLELIINGSSVLLAFIALFLGFAPVAKTVIVSGDIYQVVQADNTSLYDCFSSENDEKFIACGVVIIVFLLIAIIAIGLVIAADLLKKRRTWDWILCVSAVF